jgi:plasmid stabilization system protein ParE
MEEIKTLPVTFAESAERDINHILYYIAQQGYPEVALAYTDRIYDFCHTLGIMPDKFPLCRKKGYSRYQYRCVVFEHTYIIAYKIEKHEVVIKHVVHGKRMA